MSTMGRRAFLGSMAAAGAAVAIGTPRWASAAEPPLPGDPFTLGVASGDPLPDAVMLWTRLAPDPLNGGGMPAASITVDWEVATDALFTNVVRSGSVSAVPEHAHSVHVDATGLSADSWYFYRFKAGGFTSPVGHTRTTPAASSAPTSMTLGFASCQSWTSGYYTAHAHLAQEDLDVVFFLGDYIYEGGGSGVRAHNSSEIFTLDAYRNRYGLYKGDPNLQAAHAAFPWIVIWDDHEVENNYADDHDENGSDPATFLVRRAAAYQAWWEHQPVRLPPPTGPDLQIYRLFQWGDLATFFALDTRQYRSDQVCMADGAPGDLGPRCADSLDPARTLTGTAQESWLVSGMTASESIWNVLANQVVFTPMPFGTLYNQDQWDGVPVQRQRIVDTFALPQVGNPLIITGDIHAAGVGEIHISGEDATTPQVATEFVGTSISSTFGNQTLIDAAEAIVGALAWVDYVNAHDRGYGVLELTRTNAHADFRVVSTALSPEATVSTDFSIDVPMVPRQVPPTTTTTSTSLPSSTSTSAPSTSTTVSPATAAAQPVSATPRFTG